MKEYFQKVVNHVAKLSQLLQQQISAMNERIATLENDNRELRTQLHEAQRGPSVMADDNQNRKDDGMPQGVATLYRA
jgi:TolA-binding protein